MSQARLSKDQIQKVALTGVGFVILLYVYFSFFLGPLNRSRNSMLAASLVGLAGLCVLGRLLWRQRSR